MYKGIRKPSIWNHPDQARESLFAQRPFRPPKQQSRVSQPLPRRANDSFIQRVRIFDDNVQQRDKELIELVLRVNPVLSAAWQWLKAHQRYTFTIKRSDGFNRISAGLGETKVSLTISPSDETKWINTVSHELNLHLLPWVRIMMFHELAGHLKHSETDDEEQLNRMRVVLGPIADNAQMLAREINADVRNKQTDSYGGNHSDIMLWVYHLNDAIRLANSQSVQTTKAAIIFKAIKNMMMPLTLTGAAKNAVDRGPGAYQAFLKVIGEISRFKSIMSEDDQNDFEQNVLLVTRKMTQYEVVLEMKRTGVLADDEEIDEDLLRYAVETGKSVDEAVFLYSDIRDSMN